MTKLLLDYYLKDDVVKIAKDLIGKVLFTNFNNELSAGIIKETEAYKGPFDKASHAYNLRRTKRNEVMYSNGGVAYVYLCYGIHSLFNIVTNVKEIPEAVLIRAIQPIIGIDIMKKRRDNKNPTSEGPGILSQALGISLQHNGFSLIENNVWLEDHSLSFKNIYASPRIGIEYAKEHAKLLWRFFIKL